MRSSININSTLQLLSFKQNSRYVFPSQVRRFLRTLTTLRTFRYSCFLTHRMKLCSYSNLGMLKVFNSSHNIPVLGMTSITRGLCAFIVHGYVICTWLWPMVFTHTSQYSCNFLPWRHRESNNKIKVYNPTKTHLKSK